MIYHNVRYAVLRCGAGQWQWHTHAETLSEFFNLNSVHSFRRTKVVVHEPSMVHKSAQEGRLAHLGGALRMTVTRVASACTPS